MASVLDLRRRIRSVKSTRQITKAMKMVSAARLRRAQVRAMAARPYAQMITSVLGSLIRRIEIIDPETGNLRHPLFATRPEKRVLLLVVSGDRGFAGAFNSNILKAGFQFIGGPVRERAAIDFFHRDAQLAVVGAGTDRIGAPHFLAVHHGPQGQVLPGRKPVVVEQRWRDRKCERHRISGFTAQVVHGQTMEFWRG